MVPSGRIVQPAHHVDAVGRQDVVAVVQVVLLGREHRHLRAGLLARVRRWRRLVRLKAGTTGQYCRHYGQTKKDLGPHTSDHILRAHEDTHFWSRCSPFRFWPLKLRSRRPTTRRTHTRPSAIHFSCPTAACGDRSAPSSPTSTANRSGSSIAAARTRASDRICRSS